MPLPFFQFYPADFKRDTCALSLCAKGGWIDILCMLHGAPSRGVMTLPLAGWARVMGATVEQAEAVIAELEQMGIADFTRDGNGNVTISSRRMLRDAITLEQTRLRVERHRRNAGRNATVNGKVTGKKLETRNQKLETRTNTLPPADAGAGAGELFAAEGKAAPKPAAPKPAKESKPRPRDPLMDALATVGGGKAAEVTQWASVAVAMKQIKAVAPELTPFEIARRAENYRTHYPECALTPTALAKHWALCDTAKTGTVRDEFGSVRAAGWGREIPIDRSQSNSAEPVPFN